MDLIPWHKNTEKEEHMDLWLLSTSGFWGCVLGSFSLTSNKSEFLDCHLQNLFCSGTEVPVISESLKLERFYWAFSFLLQPNTGNDFVNMFSLVCAFAKLRNSERVFGFSRHFQKCKSLTGVEVDKTGWGKERGRGKIFFSTKVWRKPNPILIIWGFSSDLCFLIHFKKDTAFHTFSGDLFYNIYHDLHNITTFLSFFLEFFFRIKSIFSSNSWQGSTFQKMSNIPSFYFLVL